MFVPLQECINQDGMVVGHRAISLARAQSQVPTPFALVLTTELFREFAEANGLNTLFKEAAKATTTDAQISVFARIQDAIKKLPFPQRLVEYLKECYELVILDTKELGQENKHCILTLQRSTSYEDQDYTTPNFAFSTNKFDKFLAMIKQVYLSCFTPASIVDRLRQDITDFSCGVIVSRLPHFHTVLETELDDNTFKVESYVGFVDPGKVVYRDTHTLSKDFLKIDSSQIVDQRVASIFDIEHSQIVYKEYDKATGQTAPNNSLLEAGRLTKRAKELNHAIGVRGIFLSDGENLQCLSVRTQSNSKEHAKGMARQQLAQELKRYLTTHRYPEFEDQIRGSLKRIDSGNKEDLKDALQLALTITEFEK